MDRKAAFKEVETIGEFISSNKSAMAKSPKYRKLAEIATSVPETSDKALEIIAKDVSLLPQSNSWFKQMFSKNVIKWKEKGTSTHLAKRTYFYRLYISLGEIVKSSPQSADKALEIASVAVNNSRYCMDKLSKTLTEIVKADPKLADKALDVAIIGINHEIAVNSKIPDPHMPIVFSYAYENLEQIIASRPDLAAKTLDVMGKIAEVDASRASWTLLGSLKKIDQANPKLFSEPEIASKVVGIMQRLKPEGLDTKQSYMPLSFVEKMYKDVSSKILPKCTSSLVLQGKTATNDVEGELRAAREKCADKGSKSNENSVGDNQPTNTSKTRGASRTSKGYDPRQ